MDMRTFLNRIRIPVLEWYLVAVTFYLLIMGMNQSIVLLGIVLGFVKVYIYDPIAYVLTPEVSFDGTAKVQRDISSEKPQTKKEVLKALLLCMMISGIFYMINMDLVMGEEGYVFAGPFSFPTLYWVLDKGIGKLIRKWN